ncbi:hypothetical protein ACJ73_09813, partial [Blastomyces percursus]
DVRDVLRNMTSHPYGYKHVGDDGVARSFAPNGTVIDAVGLSNEQLMKVVLFRKDPNERKYLMDLWKNVSGNSVPHHARYSPSEDLLPVFMKNSTLAEELKRKSEDQKARYGQSPNKRDSVLDPNVVCFDIICYNRTTCIWFECIDCVVYDRFHGTNCI